MTSDSVRETGALRSRLAVSFAAAALAAGTLSACAAPADGMSSPAPQVGAGLRVLVKLVQPSDDLAAIAAEAGRRAGVPARHAATVSANWHALELQCPDAAACEAALQRLRQAGTVYQSVEIDGRKHRTAG
jgi:hypothetical protein